MAMKQQAKEDDARSLIKPDVTSWRRVLGKVDGVADLGEAHESAADLRVDVGARVKIYVELKSSHTDDDDTAAQSTARKLNVCTDGQPIVRERWYIRGDPKRKRALPPVAERVGAEHACDGARRRSR